MDEKDTRIVEKIAHVKDAVVVLDHVDRKASSPAEAGATAEILAANELLHKGIEKLEDLKKKSASGAPL